MSEPARMVEVGEKEVTAREAVAECTIRMSPKACAALVAGTPKGDPLEAAKVAGLRALYRDEDQRAAVLGDGWFQTSDVGELDASGRLRVLGRRDDLIVTGGQKVLPAEVAGLLMEHPDVADAAVAGRPDDQWGQAVAAVVVPVPGSMPTLAALRADPNLQLSFVGEVGRE